METRHWEVAEDSFKLTSFTGGIMMLNSTLAWNERKGWRWHLRMESHGLGWLEGRCLVTALLQAVGLGFWSSQRELLQARWSHGAEASIPAKSCGCAVNLSELLPLLEVPGCYLQLTSSSPNNLPRKQILWSSPCAWTNIGLHKWQDWINQPPAEP